MLVPNERRLLLEALAPDEGYVLDQAIGTTYTLDLLALLRVPLAATALPWSAADGGPVQNPFALLTALRRNADRISLYCHAGATSVPGRFVPLLAFLEGAIHPVAAPNPGGIFHPKLWLLRFAGEDDSVRYRLLVLSRNLTFDRSWDVALALDGELVDRKRAISENHPLAEFVRSLPSMARKAKTRLPRSARARTELMADEVLRVRWELPDGFDQLEFLPIGHDRKPNWPFYDYHRLLVIAPFVSAEGLAALRDLADESRVIGRFDELAKLKHEDLEGFASVHVFDDQSSILDIGDDPELTPDQEAHEPQVELSGLHAKVFAGERDKRAIVLVGSANATVAAFENNVEFLVELQGSRKDHGVKPLIDALTDAGLLTDFKHAEPVEVDEDAEALGRALERKAHELSCGGFHARATQTADDRWAMTLHMSTEVDLVELRLSARPLSHPLPVSVKPAADPCATFPPTSRTSVTPFFAMRLTGGAGAKELSHEFVVKLELEGAPEGRQEAVTAELLSDRERLLRFILLLLSDEFSADRALNELERLLGTGEGPDPPEPPSTREALGLPLLEPMLRALHREPERLGEIAQLIEDLEEAGAGDDLFPAQLRELWDTVNQVRLGR